MNMYHQANMSKQNQRNKRIVKKKDTKRTSMDTNSLPEHYDPEPYYAILDLYFGKSNQVLLQHQIDSFNQFIEEIIPSILQGQDIILSEKATENMIVRYRLTFDDLGIVPPMMDHEEKQMFPLDAVQKNLTYSSKYTATITQWQDIVDIATDKTTTRMIGKPEKDVPIAKIPIMVGSKYCNLSLCPGTAKKHCKFDAGGYFIIKGNEKVILSIESMIQRKPMVFTQKEQNNVTYYVRVQSKSLEQASGNSQSFVIKIKKDNTIVVNAPRFKEVSVFAILRALGIETDEDIVNTIADVRTEKTIVNYLSILMNAQNVPSLTREEAIETLANNLRRSSNDPELRRKYLMRILSKELLPHVTSGTNNPEIDMLYKARYIGYMIHKLLKCYLNPSKDIEEYRGCDDRDSVINKRIELSGHLLGGLFEQFFKKLLNDCAKIFRSKNVDNKKPPNIIPHIKPNSIEQGLRQALSTGNFGQSRKGVSQTYSRQNNLHAQSFMRRVISLSIDSTTNKMISPRHLHNTQYGTYCPLETPDGSKIGLIKNLSLMEYVTNNMNSQIPIIRRYLRDKIQTLESIDHRDLHTYVKIFLNNSWIGSSNNIRVIHKDLRDMRFRGEIDKMVSLIFYYKIREFHIYTEGGRTVRPYLTVTNNQLNFKPEYLDQVKTWDELLVKFPYIIEYIDKEEEQNVMLAIFPHHVEKAYEIMNRKPLDSVKSIAKMNRTNRYDGSVYPRYTHCEIHPSMILGLISSNIPYPNHNPSSRGIFQYNQARQAMGLYSSDWKERTDNSYILYHPQVPIITPRASKYTGTHIFPYGENCIVSIMSYTGYNQEDSLIMNNSAIERGLFRAQVLKKQFKEIEKNPASSQTGIFMKPDRNKVSGMKDANYDKLNEEGYVDVETQIKDGDIIIGMVTPKPITRDNINNGNQRPFRDGSVIYKSLLPGTIDKVITGTNNDGYPIIKIRIRSERIPMVGDKFSCYDDETEILTTNGWIPFEKLTIDHQVATLVNGTKLVYENPSHIQSYDYEGEMMHIFNLQVDQCVTPNHNLFVRKNGETDFQLVRADSIGSETRTYCLGIEDVEINTSMADSNKSRWCVIENYLIAGSLDVVEETIRYDITMLSNDALQNIIVACENLDLVYDKSQTFLTIRSAEMFRFLSHLNNKKLLDCEWIWYFTVEQSRTILTSLLDSREYNAYSQKEADNMQRLCLHSGYRAFVHKTKEKWIVLVSPKIHCESSGRMMYYRGKVYCCTVSSGVIYVRRNGYPVFSGNSRHSQKGTCGLKVHSADMPFTTTGLIPDLILNPNAIPKRMTVGQLIESLFSKLCAVKGVFGDATPFMGVDLEKINRELVEAGWDEWGNEVMYNGMSGRKMHRKIFIGPTYYQRLKQMVGDKAHCLTVDHEVLTLSGWKYHHQMSIDDKVATLVDNKLVYQNPKRLLYYPDYRGDLYNIETSEIDLLVTTNHRMLVSRKCEVTNEWSKYDFELAGDIYGQIRKYKKNADWDAEDYQFKLPYIVSDGTEYLERKVEMDSWLRFFGNWITYGRRIDDEEYLSVEKRHLDLYMKQFATRDSEKYLPEWVWSLSSRQAKLLLETIVSSNEHDTLYYTFSNRLADDIMRLALHCGWTCNKEPCSNVDNMWKLTIKKSANDPIVNDGNDKSLEVIIKDCITQVFCLEVPGEIFYVRRNGKAVWTGNSRARGQTQLMTRAPPEGRSRDGGLRNGEMERDALCAHGMACFQKERMVDNSDIYTTYVCDLCGLLAHKVPDENHYICTSCHNSSQISTIVIPYAFKLFMQELRSINILGRIRTMKSIIVPNK